MKMPGATTSASRATTTSKHSCGAASLLTDATCKVASNFSGCDISRDFRRPAVIRCRTYPRTIIINTTTRDSHVEILRLGRRAGVDRLRLHYWQATPTAVGIDSFQ